jgi:hypothetical protein
MQVEHRNCKEPPPAVRTPLYLEITEAVNNLAAAAATSQVLYYTAYVSIRQHTAAYGSRCSHEPGTVVYSIRQHTSAYGSIRQPLQPRARYCSIQC